ncbi:Metalloendopeptidase [Aphelenchoides bicaudatus]|nr:Metalloendopeptidase [Aphelenchoides bicaudatus]
MPSGWLGSAVSSVCKNYLHFRSSYFYTCASVFILFTNCAQAALPQSDLSVLTAEDFINADRLTKDEVFRKTLPVEEINHHRSDIRGPVANQKRFKRNGVSRITKLWPQGRIPYAISPHYSTHERAILAKAVKQYHDKTCIRFVPRTGGEGDYLFIGKVDGCFSEVGRTSGVQVLSLDNGCLDYNFITNMSVGTDRGALDQFGKVDLSKTSYYGQPYDYKSILHYDSLAFSKNGFPTMLPKKSGFASTIGNAKDFSEIDLAKINRMYKCEQRKPTSSNFLGAAKAQVAPIYAPSSYFKSSYGRPNVDSAGHYASYFEPMKTPPQPICEDRITVCWWTQDRCLSPNIYVMMKTLCAKTCKFC